MPKSRSNRTRKSSRRKSITQYDGLTRSASLDGKRARLIELIIHGEPTGELAPEVNELMIKALHALQGKRAVEGEALLKQALRLAPDEPSLHNNLVAAYEQQGRKEESVKLARKLVERFPDYLFARTNYAIILAQSGASVEARDLLTPLFKRTRFHFVEFESLASALIEISLAEGNKEAARQWLATLEQVVPDAPSLNQFRLRISPPRLRDLWKLFRSRR